MSNYNPQEDVATFMRMVGQEVNTTPTIPNPKVLLLRAKLLFEETLEFIEAAGCFVSFNEDGKFEVFYDGAIKPDLVSMYDGLCDINYVSYGAANALGLDMKAGHDEVQRSNMSKANPDGTFTKNKDGKIIKSSTYSPADLKSIIEGK